MTKQGYVSLGVALCAALGVHAFIFLSFSQSMILPEKNNTLQISLLPQKFAEKEPAMVKQKDENIITSKRYNNLHINSKTTTSPQHKLSATNKSKTKHQPDIQTTTQVIPTDIQQNILAHITYPKQAKRRGWEGTAKFSLEVQQQVIKHTTILVSTGYQSLDLAAQKGISSIQSLPLHDGQHILPVTFKLQ